MKSYYLLFILFVIYGYTFAQSETNKILDYPSYSDTISYSGCDEIFAKTPKAEDLIIYSDSIIDFQNIDTRVPLKLKFNWVFEGINFDGYTGYNSIGVESFEIIKDNQRKDKIDLVDLINMDADYDYYIEETEEVKDVPNKRIYLTDLNLDSYLDIGITEGCGKSCHKIYFLYNPIKQTFQKAHKSYNFIRPIKYECQDDKIILYSYAGGSAWYTIYHAKIIRQDSLEFYQKFEFNAGYQGEKYCLHIYENAIGDSIKIDTIPK